jgi:hypothetical protein
LNYIKDCQSILERTAEGIELKSGIYVPMNVFNMCCYCLYHLKIQNGHQLSLLCIGQFVMAIILTWVLFCSVIICMRQQDNEGMNYHVQLEVDDPRRISVHLAPIPQPPE